MPPNNRLLDAYAKLMLKRMSHSAADDMMWQDPSQDLSLTFGDAQFKRDPQLTIGEPEFTKYEGETVPRTRSETDEQGNKWDYLYDDDPPDYGVGPVDVDTGQVMADPRRKRLR